MPTFLSLAVLAGLTVLPSQTAMATSEPPSTSSTPTAQADPPQAPEADQPQAPQADQPQFTAPPQLDLRNTTRTGIDKPSKSGAEDRPALKVPAGEPRGGTQPRETQVSPLASARAIKLAQVGKSTSTAPCPQGAKTRAGLVRFDSIPGVTVSGRITCTSTRDFRIQVSGGRGTVGGVVLASGDFSGTVTSRKAVITSKVSVAMTAHPRVIPAWDQQSVLNLSLAKSLWSGSVKVLASKGANKLEMTGPVQSTGLYRLTAKGSLGFAGTTVALQGTYTSGASASSPKSAAVEPIWQINGSAASGTIEGVPAKAISIAMTQVTSGITGTADLSMPNSVVVNSTLAYVDQTHWTLTATGSPTATWAPSQVSGLSVDTGVAQGTVVSDGETITWGQFAPMTIVDEKLTMKGRFFFEGASTWRMRMDDGSGSILGAADGVNFARVDGDVVISKGSVKGTVFVGAYGALLAGLPAGWVPSTVMHITFAAVSGQAAVVERSVAYMMSKGSSYITLSSDSMSSDAFKLTASGSVKVGDGAVPFSGTYESTGYVSNGVARTEPYYSMSGSIWDAAGGSTGLAAGMKMVGGSFGFSGGNKNPATFQTGASSPRATSSMSGTVNVALSDGSSFTLSCELVYSDEDNWTLTVGTTQGDPWTPFTGLTIQTSSFHGYVNSVEGDLLWNVTIDEVDWTNMSTGVDGRTGFVLSDECPLTEHCPDFTDVVYVGFTNGYLHFPNPVLDLSMNGAFTTDANWARFDAIAGDQTWDGIEVSDADLAIWYGEKDDDIEGLEMPDLSEDNNGFGIEFSGTFQIDVPDIGTVSTMGSVAWSPEGVVMGQVGMGGEVPDEAETDDAGVKVDSTTLAGFAWTDLDSGPVVVLNGTELTLEADTSYLTAEVQIPAATMQGIGAGNSPATFTADGWYDGSDFSLDTAIAVDITNSGFTLKEVSLHIGYDGSSYDLSFGVDAEVSVSGNHYPADFTLSATTNPYVVTLSLGIRGGLRESSATDFNGTFDTATLLPSGDFEPDANSIIDGTFDGKPTKSVLNDGTFEDADAAVNLLTNPDFETGVQPQIMPNGDFESGINGNLLDNADAEDGNSLLNGGLEEGMTSWDLANGFTLTATSPADNAPSTAVGQSSSILKNNNGGTSNVGLSQTIPMAPVEGASYTLTAWIKSPDSSNSRIGLYVNQTGTASNCGSQQTATTSNVFTSSGSWTKVTLPVTGVSCRTGFTITLDPVDGGGRVILDSMTFELNSSSSGVSTIANTNRPSLVDRFDVMPPIDRSGGVTNTYDYGNTLRNGGCSSNYWKYNTDTYGYANGDFDVSINTMHLTGNNKRDMGSLGFWLNGSGTAATGFSLRAQTANGDGGFWQVSGGSSRALNSSGNYMPDLAQNVWYQIRVTAYGNWVTGKVTRLDTGEQIWNQTVNVGAATGSLPHSGTFGQVPDGYCSSEGTRWDEFNVYQGTSKVTTKHDPANAHSGSRYVSVTGSASNWDAQYTTGEQPDVGATYSYSAWVRSRGGNVFANLFIDTPPSDAAPYESNSVGFTATSTWQLVTVSLKIANSGHTDIRPGLLDVAGSGVEIDLDDQNFSSAPWISSPSPVDAVQIVSSDAHGGTGALSLTTRRTDKASVYYDLPGWPGVGTTYTVTAWMKSATPVNVDLKLSTVGGTLEEAWTSNVTGSGWTKYTTVLTTSLYGHANLRLNIDIIGNQYETVLIDDVEIYTTGQQSDQDGSVSDLADPTPWTNLGGEVKWINASGNAHSGMGHMAITPSGNYAKDTQYTVSATPKAGATYTATAWVKGAGCGNGYLNSQITLSSGLESATTSFVANPNYQLVTVTLPITKTGSTGLTIKMANTQNSSSCYLFFDDVGVQLVGLGLNDNWVSVDNDPNGVITTTVLTDSTQAHQGSNYLEVKANGSNGYIYVDTDFRPIAGTQQTLSFWARSPNGQPFSGTFGLFSYGGSSNTDDENHFIGYSTTGTGWQQFFVTLQINNTGNTILRTEINVDSVGVVGQIDDVVSSLLPNDRPAWTAWSNSGNAVNEMIVPDASRAAEGTSYITVANYGTNGGGIESSIDQTLEAGSVYTMSMYIRSTTGAFVDGQFGMTFAGTNAETLYQYYTASADWQQVTMSFTATKGNTKVQPLVDVFGSGSVRMLDIDSIVVSPQAVIQDDPWGILDFYDAGPVATVLDDSSLAHDGSYGFLEFSTSRDNAEAAVFHDIAITPQVGETYSGSVWVRSPSGARINGRFCLWSTISFGGDTESACTEWSANSDWQMISARLPITKAGNTMIRSEVWLYDDGLKLHLDDAEVQKVDWQVLSASTTQQTLLMDGESAQSGSGYLHIDYSGTGDGVAYQDTPFAPTGYSNYTLTAWVRSPTGQPVTGRLYTQAYGGSTSKDANSPDFTTSGTEWQQVSVTLVAPPSDNTTLRNHVVSYTSGVPLDVDSIEFTKDGEPEPDGVNTPLPHPESGYAYLWDDAFGIPGMHLWDFTAQIEAYDVYPYFGLGLGATVYMDPAKMGEVMDGTDWLKGSLAVNISSIDPCFSLGFDGTGTNARIAIEGGVFSTQKFTFGIAPKGCQIGDYVVPEGVTLGIDTAIGDTDIHLDIVVAEDEEGDPTFYTDAAVHNAVIAGTTYNTMELIIDLNSDTQLISFVGDMTLPMGAYYADLILSMDGSNMHMEGDVSLSDWELAGGTFDVNAFDFYMDMDVPMGDGACANLDAGISGDMSMAKKSGLLFDGSLSVVCGRLSTLHMEYDYSHKSSYYVFGLDYDSKRNLLAGGFKVNLERSTSWKFLGHRYNRHPKIAIAMAFSMDITKPASTTDATLGGTISVSGGSGSLQCTLSSGGDDECSFNFKMGSKYGSFQYSDTW